MTDPSTLHPARLRLDLAYDGTDFHGWATQPGLRTVQGELEAAIVLLLREPEASLTVGGRTDAGVHARGQVAHLDVTPSQLARWTGARPGNGGGAPQAAERSRARRLTGVLKRSAPDIAVHAVREVTGAFDARFSALRRRYEYRLRDAGSPRDPLSSRFTAELPWAIDLALMQRAADELLGLRDFASFCKARDGATAVRELLCFEWRETDDGAYAARVEADAFCHSMVRSLVGAVVAVGSGRLDLASLALARDARERTSRFPVMPAHGLSLEEIAYPGATGLAERIRLTRSRRDPLPPPPDPDSDRPVLL